MCETKPEQLIAQYGYQQFIYGTYVGIGVGVLATLLCMFASGKF